MKFQYVAESSEQCKDLEKRVGLLLENFKIIINSPEAQFTVSDKKFIFSQDRHDTFTEITPDYPNEITDVYPINEGAVCSSNSERVSAQVGRNLYTINYKPKTE